MSQQDEYWIKEKKNLPLLLLQREFLYKGAKIQVKLECLLTFCLSGRNEPVVKKLSITLEKNRW